MKNILITTLTLLTISTASAEYIARVPLEQNQGGSIPTGSIILNNINSGSGSSEQCSGSAGLTTTTFDTSGNQYLSFSFNERNSNGSYGNVYYSPLTHNGVYSDAITSTHRYSIQSLQHTQSYPYERASAPENDSSFISHEIYSICKEEIIGGSYGPKTCCDFYSES